MIVNAKDKFPLTEKLSDEQFCHLSKDEAMFLQIEWSQPSSIRAVTGIKSSFTLNLPPPPPNYYASSDNYKVNLKKIREYWRLGSMSRAQACIDNYISSTSFSDKRRYVHNIDQMIIKQHLLYCRITGEKPEYESEDENEEADTEIEVIRPRVERHATSAPRRILGSITPVNENELVCDEDENVPVSDLRGHQPGLFTGYSGGQNRAEENDDGGHGGNPMKKYKKGSTVTHPASTIAITRGRAIINKLIQFVEATPYGDEIKEHCNDFAIINLRTVKMTKKSGGDKNIYRLDDEGREAIFFCRSKSHLVRILRNIPMVLSNLESYGDSYEKFHGEYVVGNEHKSLSDAVDEYYAAVDSKRGD